MGLSISGFVFQNDINSVLAKHLYKTVVGYVDDLTSFGVDWETALTNREEILTVLKSYNFKLNTSKCLFFDTHVKILSHVISKDHIAINKDSLDAIAAIKRPQNQKHIKQLSGSLSYFRHFIKGFPYIAKPLTDLLKQNKPFHWEHNCELAFVTLKSKLTCDQSYHTSSRRGKMLW